MLLVLGGTRTLASSASAVNMGQFVGLKLTH
jgi:hypothetical protein